MLATIICNGDRRYTGATAQEADADMPDVGILTAGQDLHEYMAGVAKRAAKLRGAQIPHHDAEAFLADHVAAGFARIELTEWQ